MEKSQDNEQILGEIQEKSFNDYSFGCILGAFIGDACGSYYEFQQQVADESTMDNIMTMPGKGLAWEDIGAGQITDDSELAMFQLHGICKAIDEKQDLQDLNIQCIVDFYTKWVYTYPFDIGKATENALQSPNYSKTQSASEVVQRAKNKNMESLSNGALMRCTPLVVMTSKLQDQKIKKILDSDVELTHPNKLVQDYVFIYAKTIHFLLNDQSQDQRGIKAYKQAQESVKFLSEDHKIKVQQLFSKAEELSQKADSNPDVSNILINDYNAVENCGNLEHAMLLSFYFLLRSMIMEDKQKFYFKAIRDTIQIGGDTDTNACIVGGAIGALVGFHNLNKEMLSKVLNFDCSNDGYIRPPLCSVKVHAIQNIHKLLNNIPQ